MKKILFINKKTNFKKNKTTSIFFAFLFLILYSLIFNLKSATAQTVPLQSLKVTPIINDLKLVSGEPMTFPLTIQNLSGDPVGIHTTLSGYDQIGEVPLYEQKQSQMIKWTHLSKTDILLSPHSIKTIMVTITPPHHLGPSGYYQTIFLTPIVDQQVTPGSPIILSRLGILILGTIGDLNYANLAKKVTVSNFSPSQTILNNFPKTISFTVNDYYFTHFDAKPFITITPLFGKPQTTLLQDKHVLPGSARIWNYQQETKWPNVFYRLHLAVSVGGGKQVFADTWFIVLPYKLILYIITILVILYFVLFKTRRIGRAIKIIFKG